MASNKLVLVASSVYMLYRLSDDFIALSAPMILNGEPCHKAGHNTEFGFWQTDAGGFITNAEVGSKYTAHIRRQEWNPLTLRALVPVNLPAC